MGEARVRTEVASKLGESIGLSQEEVKDSAVAIAVTHDGDSVERAVACMSGMTSHAREAFARWLGIGGRSEVFQWLRCPSGQERTSVVRTRSDYAQVGIPMLGLEFALRGKKVHLESLADESTRQLWAKAISPWKDEGARVAGLPVANLRGREIKAPSASGAVLAVEVPRESLGSSGVRDTLKVMDGLIAGPGIAMKKKQSLVLSFTGYEHDEREVWEIDEVRDFLQQVTVGAPWWLWVAHPVGYPTWFGCMAEGVGIRQESNGKLSMQFRDGSLSALLNQSLMEAHEYMQRCGWLSGNDELGAALQDLVNTVKQHLGGAAKV